MRDVVTSSCNYFPDNACIDWRVEETDSLENDSMLIEHFRLFFAISNLNESENVSSRECIAWCIRDYVVALKRPPVRIQLGLSDRNNVITGRVCQLAVGFNCDELQTLLVSSSEFNGDRRAIVQNDSADFAL